MRVKVQKWENSLALKIPKAFASQTKIQENEFVNISLEGNKILIDPTEKKLSLEDLVKKIDETNLHGEINL